MNKILLIIQREFLTRIRKRSFIIMTIIGPVLSAAIFILPAYFAMLPGDEKVIIVLDEPALMDFDKGKVNLRFNYLPPNQFSLQKAKDFYMQSGHYGLLYIPSGESYDPDYISKNIILYTQGDVNLSVENYVQNQLEKHVQHEKLRSQGVDPEILARTKSKVRIRTINTEEGTEKESLASVKMGIGYVAGFLIYIFVFLYGAQLMRGVIEEKTSRIVEVMISSVKPFQLMMGKILGLAGVALLQFILWVIFGIAIYYLAMTFLLGDVLAAENVAQGAEVAAKDKLIINIFKTIGSINFPYIIGCFIFFFLFGYLLYAAIFAAIGSAVDKESDTQQFMLPVSLPLIAAIVVLIRALDNPDGAIAFWFSMVPFTSPIVMMARVPFGVPAWELFLSMVVLVLTFIAMTWIAARIYRTGILMYGKKPGIRELYKWITYKQ